MYHITELPIHAAVSIANTPQSTRKRGTPVGACRIVGQSRNIVFNVYKSKSKSSGDSEDGGVEKAAGRLVLVTNQFNTPRGTS